MTLKTTLKTVMKLQLVATSTPHQSAGSDLMLTGSPTHPPAAIGNSPRYRLVGVLVLLSAVLGCSKGRPHSAQDGSLESGAVQAPITQDSEAPAATPAPATDIVVLSGSQLRSLVARPESLKVLRVTNRPEYDNQPSFHPSGDLLFTAAGDEGTTDIHRFKFNSDDTGGSAEVVVDLEQSLYSPTPIPGENAISIVRDYGNQVQQLWKVPLGGGPLTPLLTEINPIGYHAWMADGGLLLFVLGDPPTLQRAAIGAKTGEVLGPDPGRCLARIPTSAFGPDAMSYVQSGSSVSTDSGAPIMALDPDGTTRVVTEGRPGSQDYSWAPDGSLWMGEGPDLYTWTQAAGWRRAAQLAPLGLSGISRMAWSHDGSRLALVVEHSAPIEAP